MILEMRKEEAGAKISLRQQPFASPENLQNVVAQSWKTLKTNKSKVQESMSLYLANKDTEYILLKPVKVRQNGGEICILLVGIIVANNSQNII